MDICKEAGNPTPKWELEPGGDGLWLRFPFSAAYQVPDSPGGSDTIPKTIPKTTQERILALLESEPELTQRMLAERVGLSLGGIKYHLTKLRAAGAIRHVGSARAGRWEVLKKTIPKTTLKTTSKTTQERILALLESEPELTQRMLAERVGLSLGGVKYHLTKLRSAGAIRHVGSARAGRWEVLK